MDRQNMHSEEDERLAQTTAAYLQPTGWISDYKVLKSQVHAYLSEDVQKLITKGWQPYGSLAAADGFIYQAMIKRNQPALELEADARLRAAGIKPLEQ